jgi:hypothetical protein
MRKSMKIAFWTVSAAVIAAGCNSGGGGAKYEPKTPEKKPELTAIPADTGMDFWPVNVGNQWTYEAETVRSVNGQQNSRTYTITFRVASVTPQGDGKKVLLESWEGDTKPAKPNQQTWFVSPKGIYQVWVGSSSNAYNPMQPAMLFPSKVGENFKYKGTGLTPMGTMGTQSSVGKVRETQLVDTAMGQMSALPVEANSTFTGTVKDNTGKTIPVNGKSVSTIFWTPKVGFSRYRQEIAFTNAQQTFIVQGIETLRLKAHTLK